MKFRHFCFALGMFFPVEGMPEQLPEPFRIAITRTTDSIKLHCEQGCIWTLFDHKCIAGLCKVSLSTTGHSVSSGQGKLDVISSSSVQEPDLFESYFNFDIVPIKEQLILKCQAGCTWDILTVDCRDNSCVATVDETGVALDPTLNDPGEILLLAEHPSHEWPNCLIQHLATTKANGGPITFEIAVDEAKSACIEFEEKFRAILLLRNSSTWDPKRLDDVFHQGLQNLWDKLPENFPQ